MIAWEISAVHAAAGDATTAGTSTAGTLSRMSCDSGAMHHLRQLATGADMWGNVMERP